jgi:hypothetical protein
MIENILHWYNNASPTDISEGRGWYPYALMQCREIADRHDIEIERVVYAVAALSPMLKWEWNLAACEAVIEGETSYPGVFSSNIEKALHILHDAEDWERWLSGNKVTNFAKNILGDADTVTIDTWAWRVWAGVEGRAKPPSLAKLYWQIAADYREAAATIGITARELQAITWVAMRRFVTGGAYPGQLSLAI